VRELYVNRTFPESVVHMPLDRPEIWLGCEKDRENI